MRQNLLLSSASLFAWLGLGTIAACDAPSSPAAAADTREGLGAFLEKRTPVFRGS